VEKKFPVQRKFYWLTSIREKTMENAIVE